MLRTLALACLPVLAACDGCDPSNAGPDASAMLDAAAVDADVEGGLDAPIALVTPTCHVYGIGGLNAGYPATAIALAGGRIYWSTSRDTLANTVHSIAVDFTDYRRYDNQVNVTGIAANANGVFWGTKATDGTAGLYRLATPSGTPTQAAPFTGIGVIAATENDIYFQAFSAASASIYRANPDGTSPTYWSSVGLADQLIAKAGKLYWGQSTIHANGTACPGGAKLALVGRAPAGSTSPTAFDVSLDGCAARAAGGLNEEYISRFATDGTAVFATSHSGNVYRSDPATGAPMIAYQALTPAESVAIAIAGPNVVFQAATGTYKLPISGGPATKIAESYGGPFAADATTVYFATHQHVCKIVVP